MAIRQGDDFQSYYYLAEIASMSPNPKEQCPSIVAFYKHVVERGDWDHEVWWEAERALARGDEKVAFLGYLMMAERGYEVAQNNVAWILDRGSSFHPKNQIWLEPSPVSSSRQETPADSLPRRQGRREQQRNRSHRPHVLDSVGRPGQRRCASQDW